jgi:hypothetical protein
MIPRLIDAVYSLAGTTTAFSVDDGVITGWDISEVKTNVTQPTAEALATELTRLQAVYDSQAYARNRKAEYDQLNQFEMMFNDDRDGTTTWVDKINEIKGRHPK